MKVQVVDNYEAMSKEALKKIVQLMSLKESPLICTASGDSPAGLYREMVTAVKEKKVNISDWSFVSLDEWVPMNGNDEGSCRYHLNQQLFGPLKIEEERICFFDGRAEDLQAECKRVDDFIAEQSGIDVAIVGIGMNGHVGMNEPGTDADLRSHVTNIDDTTQQVGQKYFKEKQQLSKGITLGIASLMEAKNVILLVSGNHKADIVAKILEGEITTQLPASLLRNHASFHVFVDKDAAQKIVR
jgi:galactosamine-6-phosphate isomerase